MPNISCEKIFWPKIHWGSALDPSWSNFKWVLFVIHTVFAVHCVWRSRGWVLTGWIGLCLPPLIMNYWFKMGGGKKPSLKLLLFLWNSMREIDSLDVTTITARIDSVILVESEALIFHYFFSNFLLWKGKYSLSNAQICMAWVSPTLVRSLITHPKAHIYGDSIFLSGDGTGQPSGFFLTLWWGRT